jgi:uncharacterized protein (DUF4415 family)
VKPQPGQAVRTKEKVTLQLSSDVLRGFLASAPGWQTRLDAALREWLNTHSSR